MNKQEKKTIAGEVKAQEFQNMEKQLQHMESEYNQYKERFERISTPQYLTDLKERVVAVNLKIKKLEKSKKKMEVNQKKKDKTITKKEEAEPEISQAVNALTNEINALDQRTKEDEAKISKSASTLQDQSAKLNEAKEMWKKLSDEAVPLSIDPNSLTSREEVKGTNKKYAELDAKKVGLEKTLQLVKTRCAVGLGEYTQKKVQLQSQVTVMADSIQKKNEYLQDSLRYLVCG